MDEYYKTLKQARAKKAQCEFLSDKKFLIYKLDGYGYSVDYEFRKDIHLACGEKVIE